LDFIKISKDLNMNINNVKRIYNEELKELKTVVYVLHNDVEILTATNDILELINKMNSHGFNISRFENSQEVREEAENNGLTLEFKRLEL
jgi:hypothetical protein